MSGILISTNPDHSILSDPWHSPPQLGSRLKFVCLHQLADLYRIRREEAKITAWENLQKAKAEAAIRKLEVCI